MKNIILIGICIIFLSSCIIPEQKENDFLKNYSGVWFEIARNENWFERNCICSYANYTYDNGFINVTNVCQNKVNNDLKIVNGKLFKNEDGNYSVTFGLFASKYGLIYINEGFDLAIVKSNNYIWFLSRSIYNIENDYQYLRDVALSNNINIDDVEIKYQGCYYGK